MSIFDDRGADAVSGRFPLTQAVIEKYQERAAIMEFDGGMSRQESEAAAFKDCADCVTMGPDIHYDRSGEMARGYKTGGRQKGTPNRVTATAREAVQLAFEGIGGIPALTAWAQKNQTEFFKLYARLIPIQQEISGPEGDPLEIRQLPATDEWLKNILNEEARLVCQSQKADR